MLHDSMFVKAETLSSVTRRRVMVGGCGGALLAGIAALALVHQTPAGAGPPGQVEAVQPIAPSMVLVFVSGAVAHPGLYRVSASARVAEAIAAAGGVTAGADPSHLPDLAALVHDGRQINVPLLKATNSAAKLDINSAAVDELAAVPGMPAGLPEAIVQFRVEWGDFTTLSQLHADLGVDPATVASLRLYLRVVPPPP